jgi:hypothetical protein
MIRKSFNKIKLGEQQLQGLNRLMTLLIAAKEFLKGHFHNEYQKMKFKAVLCSTIK